MDADELIDYALGKLDEPGRRELERRIANDPALAERVSRLVRNLSRLLDDGRDDPAFEGRLGTTPEGR